MIAFKPLLNMVLRTAPYWFPALLGALGVWYVQSLRSDLDDTRAELSSLQALAVTDDALQLVRDEVTASNIILERQITTANQRISRSMADIRARVDATGSDVEQLQIQLHPDVADEINTEICRRGYRDCDND